MKKFFTYMFLDNKFLNKALVCTIFMWAYTFCVMYSNAVLKSGFNFNAFLIYILGMLLFIIPQGYSMLSIKALIDQKENYVLPVFCLKSALLTGIKYAVSLLIMSVVASLCFFVVAILGVIVSVVAGMKILPFIIIGISILFLAVIVYYTYALIWIFATTGNLTSMLQFKKAQELIKQDYKTYLKAVGIGLLITIANSIFITLAGSFAAGDTTLLLITTLIIAMISTYIIFVVALLVAKSIRNNTEG